MNQKLKEPQIIEIKENDNEAPVFFREDTRQAEADMPFGAEVPRHPVCTETVDNFGGWQERDGQKFDDRVSPEGPERTEVDL
jgi:hypothetical protein